MSAVRCIHFLVILCDPLFQTYSAQSLFDSLCGQKIYEQIKAITVIIAKKPKKRRREKHDSMRKVIDMTIQKTFDMYTPLMKKIKELA